MITITRRLARQVRAVFRRALDLPRGCGPAVSLHTGPEGLRIRTRQGDAAVQYHQPGDYKPQEIPVPFEFLAACQGSNNEPVQLKQDGQSQIIATWNDGGIPQVVRCEAGDADPHFPAPPNIMAANPGRLLAALHDATQTADTEATRYAIHCVQLQGRSGRVAATDGRQLLVQSGFTFPFDDDVLIHRTRVFGSREFAGVDGVSIGRSDKTLVVHIGPWTLWCPIVSEARFPPLEDHLPRPQDATTVIELAEADADFLEKSLGRLPGNDHPNRPVTVDLNGRVAIRAKADGPSPPTELVLSNSTIQGRAIRFSTNRVFLARALKLGFHRIGLRGVEAPAACLDANRSFVWALLGEGAAIQAGNKAIRIESPPPQAPQATTTQVREPPATMPANHIRQPDTATSNGHHPPSDTGDAAGVDSLLGQAEVVKASLRQSTSHISALIASLKRHRRQSKNLRSALSSIRQLQDIDT